MVIETRQICPGESRPCWRPLWTLDRDILDSGSSSLTSSTLDLDPDILDSGPSTNGSILPVYRFSQTYKRGSRGALKSFHKFPMGTYGNFWEPPSTKAGNDDFSTNRTRAFTEAQSVCYEQVRNGNLWELLGTALY